MSIKTKLVVVTVVSVGLTIIAGLVLFISNQAVEKASKRELIAEEISQEIFRANLLFTQFLRNPRERIKVQLFTKATSVADIMALSLSEFEQEKEKDIIRGAQKNNKDVAKNIGQLMETYDSDLSEIDDEITNELRERLVNQITIESESTINSILGLAELSRQTKEDIQRRSELVVVALTILLAIVLGFALTLLKISIVRPIARLSEAVQDIARGKLDSRIKVISRDELGQLGLSFNNMTDQLQKSRKGLEQKTSELEQERTNLEERVKDRTKELEAAKSGLEDRVKERTQSLEAAQKATLNILEDVEIEKSKVEEAKVKDEAILESIGDGMIVTDKNRKI